MAPLRQGTCRNEYFNSNDPDPHWNRAWYRGNEVKKKAFNEREEPHHVIEGQLQWDIE